jgi:hypothetical protein
MQVTLQADPNPDFDAGAHAGRVRIKQMAVEVESFEEASRVCRAFIEEYDLGGGNWTGGHVWDDGVPVAHVSYNGRVWKGEAGTWPTDEIKF